MEWLIEHKLRMLDKDGAELGNVRIVEDSSQRSSLFDIVSVYVDEHFRSKGYAEKLVAKALAFIAMNKGDVTADCSYARHIIEDKLDRTDDLHAKNCLLYVQQNGQRFGILIK